MTVPPRIAAWLEAKAGLTADRRIGLRVTDPPAYEILAALHLAALHHRSGTGTETAGRQRNPQDSDVWITTAQAAQLLGCTDRAVRKWCRDGRISATRCGGRWLIRPQHLNITQAT
ncbi:helix-turn-helix domain-containing protein [Mycobacterium sp. SMC-19]|uniref:helix-turn-helix domain-containing protein n=1 Tax=Mycobacterium sp. SMC-19 TaxID=3381630 RepID=UPI0038764726